MMFESVFELDAIERVTAAYEHALKVLELTDRQDLITELVARKIAGYASVMLTGYPNVPLRHLG